MNKTTHVAIAEADNKSILVHYSFFDNLNYVEYLLEDQADKPRYVPRKDEFLKYCYEGYIDNDHWFNVANFLFETFGHSKRISQGYVDIRDYITYGSGINELGPIMDRHNMAFHSEDQVQDFFNFLMNAKNNTRIWQNKGYTPSELHRITMEEQKNIIKFPREKKVKVGRNDPCPCGSGKKYKKCCGTTDMERPAKLSSDECSFFMRHGMA